MIKAPRGDGVADAIRARAARHEGEGALMKKNAAAIVAMTTMLGMAQADAKGLCKLTGVYTDEYGIATATFKGHGGSLAAPDFCATPYSFKVTDETKTGFTVNGKNKTKSCGTFSASPTFMGSCSVFGGSVTIKGQTYSDTFTKQSPERHAVPPSFDLTSGLR
jgi:hypothetical protein